MSKFLEARRDWQISQLIAERDKGLISHDECAEQIQLADERFDNAKRWSK